MKDVLNRIEGKIDKLMDDHTILKVDITAIKKDVEKNTEDLEKNTHELEKHIEGVEQNRHRIEALEEPRKVVKSIAKFTIWLAGFATAAGVLHQYFK